MMGIKDLCVSSGLRLHVGVARAVLPCCARWASRRELAHTSLRIGFGRFTTDAEVDYAADRIVEAVNKLRSR